MFRVHEVTEASSLALTFVVLTTSGLTEVSDRGVFSANNTAAVKFAVKLAHAECSLVFGPELDVHIPDHMVADVVRYY